MRYWIADSETTGLEDPRPMELALLEVDEQLNVLRRYESLINPGRPCEPGAMAIHGITDEMVLEAPTQDEFFAEMQADGADFSSTCFIAHNSAFDLPMFRPSMNVVVDMCTLVMSRRSIRGCENYQLGTLVKHCGLPQRDAHTAMGDVLSVHDLLCWLVANTGRPLSVFVELAQTPQMVHTFTFGKYAGRSVMSVPRSYRDYMLNNFRLDLDMRFTLETLRKTGV